MRAVNLGCFIAFLWMLVEPDGLEKIPCIGEGNGNPLRYSCLENPRDGGAWWVAIYGVAQSRMDLAVAVAAAASNSTYGLECLFLIPMVLKGFPWWLRQ